MGELAERLPFGAPFRIGDVLAGKYRVERVLGKGGMAYVVEATHVKLGQRFAIKLLRGEQIDTEDGPARFAQEARAASRIQNDHVVKVLDVGELESGIPFMVMEMLEGSDLAQVLRERGPLPVDEAIDYLLQACEALAEAHALGIVHRDLKPGNLFLARREDGTSIVKVLDFGISKSLDPLESGARDGLTATGVMVGSPQYMSPEQLISPRNVTARSDIWTLGVVLFRLLTNELPFEGETLPKLCAAIALDAPRSLRAIRPEVPVAVAEVIGRCLAKEPGERFASVAEFAEALATFGASRARESTARIARYGAPASATVTIDPEFPVFLDSKPPIRPRLPSIETILAPGPKSAAIVENDSSAGVEPSRPRRQHALWIAALLVPIAGALVLLFARRPAVDVEPAVPRAEPTAAPPVALATSTPSVSSPSVSPPSSAPSSTSDTAVATAKSARPRPAPADPTPPTEASSGRKKNPLRLDLK